MTGPVAVPRSVLWALGGGLAVTSLLAAFLLGRQTAPGPIVVPAGSVELVAAQPGVEDTAPDVEAAAPEAVPAPTAAAAPEPRASSTPAPRTSAASAVRPADDATEGTAGAAAAYLSKMDRAVAHGETGMSPDAMAQSILQDAMAGRTDGFDRLLGLQRAVLDQVEAVRPPRACSDCAAHHRRTVALLRRSVDLLSSLRDATAQGDLRALAGAQQQAVSLETEARELEKLKARIAATYDLP